MYTIGVYQQGFDKPFIKMDVFSEDSFQAGVIARYNLPRIDEGLIGESYFLKLLAETSVCGNERKVNEKVLDNLLCNAQIQGIVARFDEFNTSLKKFSELEADLID